MFIVGNARDCQDDEVAGIVNVLDEQRLEFVPASDRIAGSDPLPPRILRRAARDDHVSARSTCEDRPHKEGLGARDRRHVAFDFRRLGRGRRRITEHRGQLILSRPEFHGLEKRHERFGGGVLAFRFNADRAREFMDGTDSVRQHTAELALDGATVRAGKRHREAHGENSRPGRVRNGADGKDMRVKNVRLKRLGEEVGGAEERFLPLLRRAEDVRAGVDDAEPGLSYSNRDGFRFVFFRVVFVETDGVDAGLIALGARETEC